MNSRMRLARLIASKAHPMQEQGQLPISKNEFWGLSLAYWRLAKAAKKAGLHPGDYAFSLRVPPDADDKGKWVVQYKRKEEEFEKICDGIFLKDSARHLPQNIKLFAALKVYHSFPKAQSAYQIVHKHVYIKNMGEAADGRFLAKLSKNMLAAKIFAAASLACICLCVAGYIAGLALPTGVLSAVPILAVVSFFTAVIGYVLFSWAKEKVETIRNTYSERIAEAAKNAVASLKQHAGNGSVNGDLPK